MLTKSAALKHFGLLKETSPGFVQLTELAVKILGNEDVASPERIGFVGRAALLPLIFAELWKKYGGRLPSDVAIRTYLVTERQFNPDSVNKLLGDFRATISFAGLSESDQTSVNEKQQDETDADKGVAGGLGAAKPVVHGAQPKKNAAPMIGNLESKALELVFNLSGTGRDVSIPYPMTAADFELFEGMIKLWKNRILGSSYPKAAIWKNENADKPVLIIRAMGERDGVAYYQSKYGTGIPATQLEFED